MSALSHIPGSTSLSEIVPFLQDAGAFLTERHRRYGDVFKTRLLFPVCFAAGPEANHAIHITERDRLSYRGGYGKIAFARIFEGSLLLKDGPDHKHDRDILQPAVGRLGLSQSLTRVQQIWDRAAERLRTQPTVDAYGFARDVTFEVSANALIDLELDEMDEWRALFEALLAGTMSSTKVRWPFGSLDKGLRARQELIDRLVPRIEAARTREPHGMVGLLAHHKEPDGSMLSAVDIAAHVLLLFWAGYDTTASTGSWLLTQLALHPAWQERVAAERARVLGARSYAVEDAEALVEHGWFLKEVERTCPVVVLFPRFVREDVTLAGVKVPRGTMLFWSPFLSHQLARVFDAPDAFDPERFSPARKSEALPSNALVGFGGGPRICLGKAFALVQLRVMMTALLSRYRITHDNGPEVRRLMLPTHRPLDVRLRFTPR